MKKSDIQNMIREEFVQILKEQTQLNESFGDPIAYKLSKMGGMGSRWAKFFSAAANTYNIAWDKLPKGSFQKAQPGAPATKKGMAFHVSTTRKRNPYGNEWQSDIGANEVLAVTVDNKIKYFYGSRHNDGSKIGNRDVYKRGDAAGVGHQGTLQVSKLKELADIVYVFDLDSYSGGTTGLKAARAELKLGKDTFKDHNAWKKANLKRYKTALAAKVGTRDQVDSIVAQIVKISNEAVTEAMGLTKLNNYNEITTTINGREVTLKSVTRLMSQSLDTYGSYIRDSNKLEQDNYSGGESYLEKSKNDYALELKTSLGKLKSGKLGW